MACAIVSNLGTRMDVHMSYLLEPFRRFVLILRVPLFVLILAAST
jgi:hypothetical protein